MKNALRNLLLAEKPIDRLKHMPSYIKGGKVYDFLDNFMFNVSNEDTVILDEKLGTRFTDALQKRYLNNFEDVAFNIIGKGEEDVKVKVDPMDKFNDILAVIEKGDKKSFKEVSETLTKDLFMFDPENVEDLLADLRGCIRKKERDEAFDIISDFLEDNDLPNDDEPKTKEVCEVDEDVEENNDDVAEIIEDLEDAIKDEDVEDANALLKELGSKHPEYKKFKKQVDALSNSNDDTQEESNEDMTDEEVIEAICGDLDDAFANKNKAEYTKYLDELLDEVGEDGEEYIKYAKKLRRLRS